jgi:uncharacterized membrane protein YkvA (DUF1232 family)
MSVHPTQPARQSDGLRSAASIPAIPNEREWPAPLRAPMALQRIKGVIDPPRHILVACMPKSGSTFLSEMIAQLPGFRRVDLVPAYERREHELDEFCLQQFDRFNFVAQHHVRYSSWTAGMCRDYGLAPIVVVRSLLDVVVSLRDQVRNQNHKWPIFFAEPHHGTLDDAELEAMIARLALPWYLNFYMGWRRAPDTMMVDYADLTGAPVAVAADVLAFAGVSASEADIEAALARIRSYGDGRMNVGVAGRGADLRPETVRAVLDLIDFYPEAADDPYIQEVKAQGLAVLSGTHAPAHRQARRTPKPRGFGPSVRRWWRRWAKRIAMRGLLPVALTVLGVLYWIWPADLLPDQGPYGHLDDVVVLLIGGILAGRLTKYKPPSPRLRRKAGS